MTWLQEFLDWLWEKFFPSQEEPQNYLILKTFGQRNFCTLSLVARMEPRAVATYHAIPLYPTSPKIEVWVWCEHLLAIPGDPIVKQNAIATHRFTVLEAPPHQRYPTRQEWIKRCKILWTQDFDLQDPASGKSCATTVAQMIATALIHDQHTAINWKAHAQKSVQHGLAQLKLAAVR